MGTKKIRLKSHPKENPVLELDVSGFIEGGAWLASLGLQVPKVRRDRPVPTALGAATPRELVGAAGIAVEPVGALGAELRHLGRGGEVVATALVAALGLAMFGDDRENPPPPNGLKLSDGSWRGGRRIQKKADRHEPFAGSRG